MFLLGVNWVVDRSKILLWVLNLCGFLYIYRRFGTKLVYKTTRCHNLEDHIYTFTVLKTPNFRFPNWIVSYGEKLNASYQPIIWRTTPCPLSATAHSVYLYSQLHPSFPPYMVAATIVCNLRTNHTMVTRKSMNAATQSGKTNHSIPKVLRLL
jgi:hypothetical protein